MRCVWMDIVIGERDDEHDERRAGGHAERVAADETLRVVQPVALARLDRLARQVAAHVGRELFDRAVAMLRLFAQRAHDDRVDVAEQPLLQLVGREPARGATARMSDCPSSGPLSRARLTAALGRSGSVMQIERSSSSWLAEAGTVYGRKPVSSSYSTTPSA